MRLRSADFGNTITVDTGVVNARSQDGDLIQIYDPAWGFEDSFSVTFSGLSEDQKYAMIDFYNENIGEEIEFTDHNNRVWLGFLVSKLDIKQSGPGCQYVISFSFIGVLQP